MNPNDIIRYIVWFATENGIRLTTNRLVKFIFLADFYHARLKNGQTITGFPWKFIHYGPYCGEVMKCIDQTVREGLISKQTHDSYFDEDREYNIFTCKNEGAEKIAESIHIGILGQIQKAIRTFGDDGAQLLDHVYFYTKPMENARKGDLLDFSKARKLEPTKKVKLKKMSNDTIELARKKVKQLSDEMNADRERLIQDEQETEQYKDDAYHKFVEMLNRDELSVGLKGTAKIQMPE